MQLTAGDRVILTRNGGVLGTVKSMIEPEVAYVKLDSGSAGPFRVDELELVPRETKAWPPRLETK